MATEPRVQEQNIYVPVGSVFLPGILGVPTSARGTVLFAHGSGSGRLSPRNNYVAHMLQEAGLATMLVDLLTEVEAQDRRLVFDIGLLAVRLQAATVWLLSAPGTQALPVGYFGASTGAGAALVAAARGGSEVRAVVSRGGRPDLAGAYLRLVRVPTLLIVGGRDEPVISLNKEAMALLPGKKELAIVPGATHLFEEAGALTRVAELASDWFLRYLPE